MNILLNVQKIMCQDGYCEWLVVSLISSVILSYINVLFFIKLFNVQASNENKLKVIFFSGVIRFLFTIIIPAPYYRAINIVAIIFMFKLFFKQNLEKCILGEIINSLSVVCIEIVFSKVFVILFSNVDSYIIGMYDYKYKFCLIFMIVFVRLLIYQIIIKKDITINISNNLSLNNKSRIIIISVIGISIIFFNSIEMTMFISDFPYSIFILDIISLVLYFYISIKDIIRISELEEKDIQIQNLESYNKTLSIMYDSIRGFRHDFSNFVQSLNGYAQTNDIAGIKHMCESIFKDCKNVTNLGILDPNIINNAAIYSIITNKYYLAQEKNIEMNIEVMVDFKDLKDYSYELCRILAILLDNAIEAAKECEEKVINVRFIQDVNRKLIIIENSYNTFDIDVDKIFEKGYTTKSDSKDEHGLGLWTVRRILCKSNNLNLFTTKGNMFCQQLEIY